MNVLSSKFMFLDPRNPCSHLWQSKIPLVYITNRYEQQQKKRWSAQESSHGKVEIHLAPCKVVNRRLFHGEGNIKHIAASR